MARRCTICDHKKHLEIDKLLVANDESFREISIRFGVTVPSLARHKGAHIPKKLAEAAKSKKASEGDEILNEIAALIKSETLLMDACDRELRDPSDPTRYNLGPRAEDIDVKYQEEEVTEDSRGRERRRMVTKVARLSTLIAKVPNVLEIRYRRPAPQDTMLKASMNLHAHDELLLKLRGELKQVISIAELEQWTELKAVILAATKDFPDARKRIVAGIAQIVGS